MKLFKKLLLLAALSSACSARAIDRGLNLPPTQGTTRDGAYFPGSYQMDYKPDQVSRTLGQAGFSALRLPINMETAHNPEALHRHKEYLDSMGGRGIICFFDTSLVPGRSWPRTGTVTGKVNEVAQAWKNVHSVFAPYGDAVLYEIFNEPWGYGANAGLYLVEMLAVIFIAGLPFDRVILAGLGGSADVQSVARAGWQGYLAYHVYHFWLPEGQRSEEQFSQKIQQDLANLSARVFITEFGVGLNGLTADVDRDEVEKDIMRYQDFKSVPGDWQVEHSRSATLKNICEKKPGNTWCKKHFFLKRTQNKCWCIFGWCLSNSRCDNHVSLSQEPNLGADVSVHVPGGDRDAVAAQQSLANQNDTINFLRGLRDALSTLKKQGNGVRGLYHWHGWHNGDTWDFWDAANARSSRLIQLMMLDQYQGKHAVSTASEDDPYLSEDFVEDDAGIVHMMAARKLGSRSKAHCPEECSSQHCLQGSEAQIGGRHLTGGFCTYNCSMLYNHKRYCGVGLGYQEGDAIDCSECAKPARCFGLPCGAQAPIPAKRNSHPVLSSAFLRKDVLRP
mmetsp:Transcript_26340/g.46326  ORF Transcript_26340/g.46326 Transcript_26340/m.46326 type:complete len:561 (+) Transcript_26340:68-1750(+)